MPEQLFDSELLVQKAKDREPAEQKRSVIERFKSFSCGLVLGDSG
jgi:hypothetical protein